MRRQTPAASNDLAGRLLPDAPGWTAEPAGLAGNEAGLFLLRVYSTGRSKAHVAVTAGPSAAQVVATCMSGPPDDPPPAKAASGMWMLDGRKALLVQ